MNSIKPEEEIINENTRLIKKKINNKQKLYLIIYLIIVITLTIILVILFSNYSYNHNVKTTYDKCNLHFKKINITCEETIICLDAASCVEKKICPNCNFPYYVTYIFCVLIPIVLMIYILCIIFLWIASKLKLFKLIDK